MLSGVQVKMARAALGLGVRELGALADVNPNTVTRFETGGGIQLATAQAIETALINAGVEFIPENGGGAGVRLSKRAAVPAKPKARPKAKAKAKARGK